jgi:hypothetical protein
MNAVSGAVQAASNRSSIGPMMSMSCVNGGVVHSKNDGGSVSLARGRLRPPPSSCMSLNQNRLRIHQEHRLLLTHTTDILLREPATFRWSAIPRPRL